MNVLISGNLSCLAATLVKAFLKERDKVVLVGSDIEALKKTLPEQVTCHAVSPADAVFKEIAAAYRFDAVVYLATREEQLLQSHPYNSGEVLDGLQNILKVCQGKGVEKFFFISSTEVFGRQAEDALPVEPAEIIPKPDSPNGFALQAGEQYCHYYHEQHGMDSTIVRVPFIYGPDERGSFLYSLVRSLRDQKRVILPADAGTVVNFLHAADAAEFIMRAIEEKDEGVHTVNLSSPDPLPLGDLAARLGEHFPGAHICYSGKDTISTWPADFSYVRKRFDWIPERKLEEALPTVIEAAQQELVPKVTWRDRLEARTTKHGAYLRWIEVILGAALMILLNELSNASVEFRYVDFRLIYVVLMGLIWGTRVGLVAALLAGLYLLFSWGRMGMNSLELIYNVANWLPFAIYLIAGTLTGYYHDKNENDIQNQKDERDLLQGKYEVLYRLYQEVIQIKNQFHEQLVGSRDSFGRIYKVTHELDTLEAEEVPIKALAVLEDVMDNRNIAIYSINQGSRFARLDVYSSLLGGQINKSLNLADYPPLLESVKSGEIFQNRGQQPGLPAYFTPIRHGEVTTGAVVIWNVTFDEYSLYYYNLFKVICGLIESSLNRAVLFMNANAPRLYLPHTRILLPQAFRKVIDAKSKMKKVKISDYLITRVTYLNNEVETGQMQPAAMEPSARKLAEFEKLYNAVSKEIRAGDYIGVLEDGSCYVLFSQADQSNAGQIERRLGQSQICLEPVTVIPAEPGAADEGRSLGRTQTGSLVTRAPEPGTPPGAGPEPIVP